jgi:hypothetical protein
MSFKHHLINYNRWFLCIAILLNLTADISSQAISNVRHFYANGNLRDVHHYYDGKYTYSFYQVNSDTFYYENQLALPLKNKERDLILIKLDEKGKVVNHAVFRSQLLENDKGSTFISVHESMSIKDGHIYFALVVDGYLEMNGSRVEGKYDHSSPIATWSSNNIVLGLDDNFEIEFQRIFSASPTTVEELAFNDEVLYIFGTFWWDSMNIEGLTISREGSAGLRKSYLYAFNVDQDSLVTKTCFAGGGNSNELSRTLFDKQGNIYIALGHDSERLFLDDLYIPGNFLRSNSLIVKLSPLGKVLDYYSTIVPQKNCFISRLVLNDDDEIIAFGITYEDSMDSIAYIGQNGNTPINTQKNWASFIFKLDNNFKTLWYNLFSAPSGFTYTFQDIFIDKSDHIYFTLYNEKGFLMTDMQGNQFEQGFHFCKMDQSGKIIVHNRVGDLLAFSNHYSMKLKHDNIFTINAWVLDNKKSKELLFGKKFTRKMDGVIYDFDIRETLSSTVEKTIDNNIQSKIFPNPLQAGEQLIVGDDRFRDGRYEIYSIQGVLIAKGTMTGPNIPTSAHFESEVYILRVSQGALSFNRLITFF